MLPFCLTFPMQSSAEKSHLSPLLKFLLTGSCILLYVFLPCSFFLPFSNHLVPHQSCSSSPAVPALPQDTRLLSCSLYSTSILIPHVFFCSYHSYQWENFISETSLHISPRWVEVGFNIRLLFRSSLLPSILSSWRPKRTEFCNMFCETDILGSPESWKSLLEQNSLYNIFCISWRRAKPQK